MKTCTKCGEEKHLTDFSKLKGKPRSMCKDCSNAEGRKWKALNKERTKIVTEKWREVNKERMLLTKKIWRDANKEQQKVVRKEYCQNNKEKINTAAKIRRENNKDKINECRRARYLLQKEEINRERKEKYTQNKDVLNAKRRLDTVSKEKKNINRIERYRSDIGYKINYLMSNGINQSLRYGKRDQSWKTLVPYTKEELKQHLQFLFVEGMTWEKFLRGEIHIDHKIPISAFNFTEPTHEDFKKCWALDNLQPLWALDNLKKGDKLSRQFQPSLAM